MNRRQALLAMVAPVLALRGVSSSGPATLRADVWTRFQTYAQARRYGWITAGDIQGKTGIDLAIDRGWFCN